MPRYTTHDIKRVDELYDHLSIPEIAEKEDMPESTLYNWKSRGWIDTDTDHVRRKNGSYSEEMVQRADTLYDLMPLHEIPNLLPVPFQTLKYWNQTDRISTEVDWQHKQNGAEKKVDPIPVVREVHQGALQKDVAEKYGISETTVSRYMQQYRDHVL